ncbi:uncharacterized protein [Physcomitrium patens]|uniref:uncharacterized protein isoform X1 n=1 Tax=Physcomitrium patens TaxID=3218 RepID=UPI003CCDFADA
MGERACDFILGRNRAVIARASRALCGRKMHTLPAASSSSRPLGHFLCHAKLGAHLSVVFQRGTPAASDQALRVSPPLIFLVNHSTIFVKIRASRTRRMSMRRSLGKGRKGKSARTQKTRAGASYHVGPECEPLP